MVGSGVKWKKVGITMLMGEFNHSIDDKNRLIIPSKLRNELGNEAVITRGLDKCLFIYSKKEWESIVSKLSNLPFTKKSVRDFNRFFLSSASTIVFDKMGRVNLSQSLLNYANLTKECVIIGVMIELKFGIKMNLILSYLLI